MKTGRLGSITLILTLFVFGCHRATTEVERDNRRVLETILTAITIKNARLLEEDAQRAKTRRDAGQFTDEEYQGLEAILNRARAGDWAGAEKDCYRFRKQHPFVQPGK